MGARPGADMGAQLMRSLLLLRLPQEQHTQGAGAAVLGHSAASLSDEYLLKGCQLPYQLRQLL